MMIDDWTRTKMTNWNLLVISCRHLDPLQIWHHKRLTTPPLRQPVV